MACDERPASERFGVVRRPAPNMLKSIIDLHKGIRSMEGRIRQAKENLPAAKKFLELLDSTVEDARLHLLEQQGFQALQAIIDGIDPR